MSASYRVIIIASSVFLLLLIALSLATAFEAGSSSRNSMPFTYAQKENLDGSSGFSAAKAILNGSESDQEEGWRGNILVSGISSEQATQTKTIETTSSLIGLTETPILSEEEGVLAPNATLTSSTTPTLRPTPTANRTIVALTYTGAGGHKHCRGQLIQKTVVSPLLRQWQNGTCINLPRQARCGVFFAAKHDHCEAQLFSSANCYDSARTFVNTVVFMPEERAIGALWSSMFVRCGVEVPKTKILDPSILGNLLKGSSNGNSIG